MERRPMTLTQKILAEHAVGLTRPYVAAGDVLQLRVDWTMSSEATWNAMDQTYDVLGRPPLHDPERVFLAIDHTVDPVTLATDRRTQQLVARSRAFAKERAIKHFYDANVTILHTKFYRDLVQPGEVVLGADSHTSSHGGMGAFAIGLGGADVTVAMVLGRTWLEVPEAIAVEYRGEPPFGIGGKDIILRTLGLLGRNTVALERTVEYRGDAVRGFSTDVRFTIANMTAEFGGLNGIFEADEVVAARLARRRRYNDRARYFRADDDAPYVARYPIELADLGPQVAKPFSPDNVFEVADVVGQPLDGCFIGACTTAEEELVLAGLILEAALAEGRSPVPVAGEQRIVVPGDLSIEANLRSAGLWSVYEAAGFVVDPPGCSMCLGIASRRAGKGETWLSSQNRNFANRMGEGSLAWLASAATVAASSLGMAIADPRPLLARIDRDRYDRILRRERRGPLPEIRTVEPAIELAKPSAVGANGHRREGVVRGRVQRFGDAVDTDAMIPGQFCHLTSPEELGPHCFRFVRPEFVERARAGATIVVAGEGWGTGSSREHAVWALRGAGIRVVVARSYAFIHKRNLANEALPHLVVEDPAFYEIADEGRELEVDLAGGQIRDVATGRTFTARPMTPMIQSLHGEGGLIPAVQRHGTRVFAALTAGA